MDISKWKELKKSGAFRRRVKKRFEDLKNYAISNNPNNNFGVSPMNNDSNQIDNPMENNVSSLPETMDVIEEESKINWDVELEDLYQGEFNKEFTDMEKDINTYKQIQKWAVSHNITHTALKEILYIFNLRLSNVFPRDPRTLLKTQKVIQLTKLKNGEYWHNGLKYCLEKYLTNTKIDSISLNVNIDGLPVFRSSKQEFWPILCNINELPHVKPMIIGIYSGVGKPVELEIFLREFVNEAKVILTDGVLVPYENEGLRKINVKFRSFICDSPARALIKGVMNFNGKHGCLKCTTTGEYSYISHTVFFPKSGCEKRTNEGFRLKQYGSHHKRDSPLLELPIDMIEDFPVGDSLHLIDLGIMKKCLVGWRDGSFGTYKTKWCARDIQIVTEYLLACKMPSEVHRAVRGLDVLPHWKGSEFHTFLHYISIVVLKEVLKYDVYYHFLMFFCAVTICSSEKYFNLLTLASTLFDSYVEYYRDYYGEDFISSNVHNLTHVVDEVKKFGVLSTFNAYPFENKLYTIKNLLRNGNCPLAQVAKRVSEITHVESCLEDDKKYIFPYLRNKNKEGHYLKIVFNNFTLASDTCNKWFLTNENKIVKMHYALLLNNRIVIYGYELTNTENLFDKPIKSSFLNIYKSSCSNYNFQYYFISNIKCKMVAMPCFNKMETVFIPLIHTL